MKWHNCTRIQCICKQHSHCFCEMAYPQSEKVNLFQNMNYTVVHFFNGLHIRICISNWSGNTFHGQGAQRMKTTPTYPQNTTRCGDPLNPPLQLWNCHCLVSITTPVTLLMPRWMTKLLTVFEVGEKQAYLLHCTTPCLLKWVVLKWMLKAVTILNVKGMHVQT